MRATGYVRTSRDYFVALVSMTLPLGTFPGAPVPVPFGPAGTTPLFDSPPDFIPTFSPGATGVISGTRSSCLAILAFTSLVGRVANLLGAVDVGQDVLHQRVALLLRQRRGELFVEHLGRVLQVVAE